MPGLYIKGQLDVAFDTLNLVNAERDELAAIVRDHAAHEPWVEWHKGNGHVWFKCKDCGETFVKAAVAWDRRHVNHSGLCTFMRARVWSEGQQG